MDERCRYGWSIGLTIRIMPGPVIRTDIVDVYVFRRPEGRAGRVAFLQLRRVATEKDLPWTWQPVMGHIEEDERAAFTALRELGEETGFGIDRGLIGFWQLESPNTYFLHSHECFVMSPCFAVEVKPGLDHDWMHRTMRSGGWSERGWIAPFSGRVSARRSATWCATFWSPMYPPSLFCESIREVFEAREGPS